MMSENQRLDPFAFAQALVGVCSFFAGVPDSLLKDLCTALEHTAPKGNFFTAANEGAAVALAAGYTLATGKPGAIYMQNSGLGNAINPLLSLCDRLICSIPALLLIGWRGEPGTHDEPQHIKQGLVTEALLDTCGIPYRVLPTDVEGAEAALDWAAVSLAQTIAPVALLIRKGTFAPVSVERKNSHSLRREDAIDTILTALAEKDAVVISTTGMISRELYERRVARGEDHARDFLTVGSMGHASQIALGVASQRPEKLVVCLDGDGAAIMHMGSLAIAGSSNLTNLLHIVLNNEAHDSVGGHPTCASALDLPAIARACGYRTTDSIADVNTLRAVIARASVSDGPAFVDVKVAQGARKDLGRPSQTPVEGKALFMKTLEG